MDIDIVNRREMVWELLAIQKATYCPVFQRSAHERESKSGTSRPVQRGNSAQSSFTVVLQIYVCLQNVKFYKECVVPTFHLLLRWK